jgi:uncharacterized protein with von Willebrand factor type A (vWA) domain
MVGPAGPLRRHVDLHVLGQDVDAREAFVGGVALLVKGNGVAEQFDGLGVAVIRADDALVGQEARA